MDYFDKKAKQEEVKEIKEDADLKERKSDIVDDEMLEWVDWTGKKNVTLKIYNTTMELFDIRDKYIEEHNKKQDFVKKSDTYKISAIAVARKVGIARTSLVQTSTYSKGFSTFLSKLNERLKEKKDSKFISHRKNDADDANKKSNDCKPTIKQQLADVKAMNVEQQVNRALDLLSPEVRELLTIDTGITRASKPDSTRH